MFEIFNICGSWQEHVAVNLVKLAFTHYLQNGVEAEMEALLAQGTAREILLPSFEKIKEQWAPIFDSHPFIQERGLYELFDEGIDILKSELPKSKLP